MAKRPRFNRKRKIIDPIPNIAQLAKLANRVSYVGSPYHKRNPGNFNLTPPAQPRPDTTLCDGAGIFTVAAAQHLLQDGARRGLISNNPGNEFPKYIWAVTDDGMVLEARASGGEPGEYHGYPIYEEDPFREVVIEIAKHR